MVSPLRIVISLAWSCSYSGGTLRFFGARDLNSNNTGPIAWTRHRPATDPWKGAPYLFLLLTRTVGVGVVALPEGVERIDHARVNERDLVELAFALGKGHVQVPHGYIDRKWVWQRHSLYSWHCLILHMHVMTS